MTILFTLVNLLLIAFVAQLVWRRKATFDSTVFWLGLALRLAAGISIGLVYTYYYHGTGDTFAFFNDAISLAGGNASTITSEPRSLFFIYIVRIINVITGSNYWLTSLWFSLFSFICSYRLVTKLDEIFPTQRLASRIALLFFPSFVFWSSGIVKESLAFGAVAILSMYFLSIMYNEKIKWRGWIEILLSLFILLNLKYYWAGVLIPSMLAAFTVKKIDPKVFVAGWYLIVFVVLCLAASVTHPNFYLSRFLDVIVENHDMYLSDPNIIRYYDLTSDWISILVNSPLALFSGLLRPLANFSSATSSLASLENLVLLVLIVWKIRSIRFPGPENRLSILAVLFYITVLCIFLALSTPNFGTLSRYRVGFLPFFVLLILADHPILNFINGKPGNHIRS